MGLNTIINKELKSMLISIYNNLMKKYD